MAKDYVKHRSSSNQRKRSPQSSGIPGWFWLLTGLVLGFLVGGLFYLKSMHKPPVADLAQLSDSSIEQKPSNKHKKPEHKPEQAVADNQPHFDFYSMLPKMKVGNPNAMGAADQTTNNNDDEPSPPNLQNIDPAQKALNQTPTAASVPQNQATPENALANSYNPSHPSTKVAQKKDAQSTPDVLATTAQNTNNLADETDHKAYIIIVKQLQTDAQADKLKANLLLSGFDVKQEPVNLAGQNLNRILLGPFRNQEDAKKALKSLEENHLKGSMKSFNLDAQP